MYLVSPTEHDLIKLFPPTTAHTSPLPERHGCDVIAITPLGLVGFQRKTLPDLSASLEDGRLYKEVAQLNASANVSYAYLILESRLLRTVDGALADSPITLHTLRSVIAKLSVFNMCVLYSESTDDTVACIDSVSRYLASGRAGLLKRPKQSTNQWGKHTSEDFSRFVLQSFPNIGPHLASAIYAHFGRVPIAWTVTAEELAETPGIGRRRAEKLIAALPPPKAL
jgi:DNA excision repair protein ERCC-4